MEFYGVVGEKLSHSLSPNIHNRVFNLLNIEGAYKIVEIPKDRISNLGQSMITLGIKGVNVTIPYKQVVMEQLDFISKEAENIGAINTIYNKDGKLHGYNTDYYGFGMMLDNKNIKVKDKIAVVLGNGGAAKAINAYLLDNKVKDLYLVTRNKNSIDEIDNRIKIIDYEELKEIKGDILVNTTPVGMYPNVGVSPVSEEVINNFQALVDIIYNPMMTEFLSIGKKLNKVICGGLYMLVGQAIKAEEIWQGYNIDKEVVDKIYEEINSNFI